MYTNKYDEHGKLYFRLLTTKYNDLKWQDYTSNANTWNAIKVLACSIQLKTLKDLISVVSTLAKFVAFFIKTFIAGSFMSRPVVFPAAKTVCMKVSATSRTFPIRDWGNGRLRPKFFPRNTLGYAIYLKNLIAPISLDVTINE